MSIPNKWTIKELLVLTYLNELTSNKIKLITEEFSGLDEFVDSDYLQSSSLKKGQLFLDNYQEIIDKAENQLDIAQKNNISLISIWDEEYPPLLKYIEYPPVILFVKGKLELTDLSSISIVGTRKCTQYGKIVAEKFAESFARNKVIVTSGLAYGIDQLVHKTVVHENGKTYAVIASGLDAIIPIDSQKLSNQILEKGGAIISEYKCGTSALPGYFPQRNRIISGLSVATVVIESAEKGGSLITARFAFDQGRDVYAVPGELYSERSKGCNLLIKNNLAQIAISPEQVLEDKGLLQSPATLFKDSKAGLNKNSDEYKIYDILSNKPIHTDEILEITGMDMSVILVKLLELEFKGFIRQLPGKYYIRMN